MPNVSQPGRGLGGPQADDERRRRGTLPEMGAFGISFLLFPFGAAPPVLHSDHCLPRRSRLGSRLAFGPPALGSYHGDDVEAGFTRGQTEKRPSAREGRSKITWFKSTAKRRLRWLRLPFRRDFSLRRSCGRRARGTCGRQFQRLWVRRSGVRLRGIRR